MQGHYKGFSKTMVLYAIVLAIGTVLFYIGEPGALGSPFIEAVGYAVISNYAILLAVGIAIALAVGNQGAAGLAGFIAYEIILQGATAINGKIDITDKSAFVLVAGLIAGVLGGLMYNKFYKTRLPDYLGFFGGRRFVPIVTAGMALFIALVLGYTWNS